MRRLSKVLRVTAFTAAAAVLAAHVSMASAALIVKDNTTVSDIPGIASFQTNGDEMTNMSVRAIFSGGLDQTLSWAATGPGAGGVTGAGWSLSVSGDTFAALWSFTIEPNANLGRLNTLELSGNPGRVTFDTTNPNPGTPNSAQGADFTITGALDGVAIATYSDVVAVIPNTFEGDEYHVLTVTFQENQGPTVSFTFRQDTDNDIRRFQAPEPGSLGLLGAALAAVGFSWRRRKSA